MTEQKVNTFQQLESINVSDKVENKNGANYLSWAFAWAEMKKIDPLANISFREYPLLTGDTYHETITVPWLTTQYGTFVECTVTLNGHSETEALAVMAGFKNATDMKPDMRALDKTKKRCFVKALALHGLGLYLYKGEDYPDDSNEQQKQQGKPKQNKPQQNKGLSNPSQQKFEAQQAEIAHQKKQIGTLVPEVAKLLGNEQGDVYANLATTLELASIADMKPAHYKRAIEILTLWKTEQAKTKKVEWGK